MASQYIPLSDPGSRSPQPNGSGTTGPWLPDQLDYSATTETGADIVTGYYQGDLQSHVEGQQTDPYARYDFTQQTSVEGSGPTRYVPDSALVRMRRSMEQPEGALPTGATGGPPVPTMFSRGDPLLLYDNNPLLANGFPVRTTAIAQWTPAVSIRAPIGATRPTSAVAGVGYADPNAAGLQGSTAAPITTALPFAIPLQWPSQTQWLALSDSFWVASSDQDQNTNQTSGFVWNAASAIADATASGLWSQTATVTINSALVFTYTDPNVANSASSVAAQVIMSPVLQGASSNAVTGPVIVGEVVQQAAQAPMGTPQAGIAAIYHLDPAGTTPPYLLGFAYVGLTQGAGVATITRYFTTNSVPPNYPYSNETALPVFVTRAVHNASATFGAVAPNELAQLTAAGAYPSSLDISTAMTLRSNREYSSTNLIYDPATGLQRSSISYLLSAPAQVRAIGSAESSN
jgi:hypothetical protein